VEGTPELDDRTRAQLAFLVEADRLKSVLRANPLVDGSRRENTAEHSWHIALMAAVLVERSSEPVDLGHALCLCLVHDLVEIDAGDTVPWDVEGLATKAAREEAAADRLFALLPADQAATFRGWWDEYEAGETAEARLAKAVDSLAPLIVNHASGGQLWREKGRTEADVRARNARLAGWAPDLVPVVDALVDDAVRKGWL
jgi:putative hydrolase of HD superfamily